MSILTFGGLVSLGVSAGFVEGMVSEGTSDYVFESVISGVMAIGFLYKPTVEICRSARQNLHRFFHAPEPAAAPLLHVAVAHPPAPPVHAVPPAVPGPRR